MKISVDVECTPAEARQFFGLPDLQPLQARVMAEVEKKMLADMERFAPDAILKTWLSMFSSTPEQVQSALGSLMMRGGDKSG